MQVRYQAAPRPDRGWKFNGKRRSAAQQLEDILELHADLADDLLALREIRARFFSGQALARAADREAFFVEQAANLPDDQHVLPLIVAAVAAALDGLELRELLLPVPEHVRLHAAKLADLTDREVPLPRDRRELVVIPGFQHRLPRAPSASGPGEKLRPFGQLWEFLHPFSGFCRAADSCRAGRSCRSPRASPALRKPMPLASLRRTDPRARAPRACSSRAR